MDPWEKKKIGAMWQVKYWMVCAWYRFQIATAPELSLSLVKHWQCEASSNIELKYLVITFTIIKLRLAQKCRTNTSYIFGLQESYRL